MAGADYVASLPYFDNKRIAAAGASFGGYMMNWFAVNTTGSARWLHIAACTTLRACGVVPMTMVR